MKLLCDEVFGRECFLNEIVWAYDYGGKPKRRWPAKHDTILVYVRDPDRYWFDSDAVEREPYMAPGLVTPEKAARGKLPTDCWWHTIVPTSGRERTGYPTQKPEGLVRRMVQASTPARRPRGRLLRRLRHAGRGRRGARPPLRPDRLEPRGGRGHGAAAGRDPRSSTLTPAPVPTTATPAMPRKNPCSTTPGTLADAGRERRGIGPVVARRQSRIALPSSVTNGVPAAAIRSAGRQPSPRSLPVAHRPGELDHLDRQRHPLAQPRHQLGLVGDDDHELARRRPPPSRAGAPRRGP